MPVAPGKLLIVFLFTFKTVPVCINYMFITGTGAKCLYHIKSVFVGMFSFISTTRWHCRVISRMRKMYIKFYLNNIPGSVPCPPSTRACAHTHTFHFIRCCWATQWFSEKKKTVNNTSHETHEWLSSGHILFLNRIK